MTRQLEDDSFLILCALESGVIGRALDLYVAIVSKATSHVHRHDSGFDRSPYAMYLRRIRYLRWPSYTASHWVKSLDLVIGVCRAHPGRSGLELAIVREVATIRWIRKWRA